ncbi:MAG: COG4315 family predicted lipoprotein [Polaromonas sp.]
MKTRLIAILAVSVTAMAPIFAQADMLKPADGMLVNAAGMTVYTFDKDVAGSGKSTCNGPCLTAWPAVMAEPDAKPEGDMTIVTRDDGAKQWAYKGKPVYLYASDAKPGDKKGDNFKEVWHVVKP